MNNDPLIRPYVIKNLLINNRLMTSAHEPSYAENGMPKERYIAYHAERAKGGICLTITAGSAIISPDSPSTFGNLNAYKDKIVPWLKKLTKEFYHLSFKILLAYNFMGLSVIS